MIAKSLRSLLKYNSRVNIPTLGAIIKQQDFSQALFFNQFIKYDDGLLLHHLTRVEMLSQTEAQDLIDQFIGDVQRGVHTEGQFQIDEIGVFCLVENRLELLSEKDFALRSSYSPTRYAMETSPDVSDHPREPHNPDDDFYTISTDHSELPPSSLSVHAENLRGVMPAVADDKTDEKMKRFLSSSKIKKPTLLFLLFVLVVILALRSNITLPNVAPKSITAGTAHVFTSDSNNVASHTIVEQSLPEPAPETASTQKIQATEVNLETNTISDPVSGYHVVVGSFTQESNADQFVAAQQALGRNIRKIGFRGGFHFVGYEIGVSADSVQKKFHQLRSSYPEAWITKF